MTQRARAGANTVWTLRGKGAVATLAESATGNRIAQDCLDLKQTDAGQHAPITLGRWGQAMHSTGREVIPATAAL